MTASASWSAPRVWWTFKVMGARDVVILEGGLPKWIAEGRPVDACPVSRPHRVFRAAPIRRPCRNLGHVQRQP